MLTSKTNNDWVLWDKMNFEDTGAFESLYEKYAAMMFGCILNICKEEKLASHIFKQIFLNLKDVEQSKPIYMPFAFWLWQHTGTETLMFIRNSSSINVGVSKREGIIDYLCIKKGGREEGANFFNIDNNEVGLLVKKDLQFLK